MMNSITLNTLKYLAIFTIILNTSSGCIDANDQPTSKPQDQKPSLLKRLSTADKKDYGSIVESAWNNGEDVTASEQGTNVLHYLAQVDGNYELIENIIKKNKSLCSQENSSGVTPLHTGSLTSVNMLDIFIENNYHLALMYENKNTILHKLVATNDPLTAIEHLIAYRGEEGMQEFLSAENEPEHETAYYKLCNEKNESLCKHMLKRLLRRGYFSPQTHALVDLLSDESLSSQEDDTTSMKDYPADTSPESTPIIEPESKKPLNKATREEAEKVLAPWRTIKSSLAGVAGRSKREEAQKEALQKILALDTQELILLLEQDWVWTSLVEDLKKELAANLKEEQLNIFAQALQNKQLRNRVGYLDITLSKLVDEIDPNDPQLTNKIQAMSFAATLSLPFAGSLEKKLGAYKAHHPYDQLAIKLDKQLKAAAKSRQAEAQKNLTEIFAAKKDYFSTITPETIQKALQKEYNNSTFWSPIITAPKLVLEMKSNSITTLFSTVVSVYKSDPMPHEHNEPLVVLKSVCRELDPNSDKFDMYFNAIVEGAKENFRDMLHNTLKNKVEKYNGPMKEKYLQTLQALKEHRINKAKGAGENILKQNQEYNKVAEKAGLQRAALTYQNAVKQTSIDDQVDNEEQVAGYIIHASSNELDNLWKQFNRTETGLEINNNISQRIAWSLAYLSEQQMTQSLKTESFWKIVTVHFGLVGSHLSIANLQQLFETIDDKAEFNRRDKKLGGILIDILNKINRPVDEMHLAFNALQAVVKSKRTKIESINVPTNDDKIILENIKAIESIIVSKQQLLKNK